MKVEEVLYFFGNILASDPDKSVGVAVVETLIEFLDKSEVTTIAGLRPEFSRVRNEWLKCNRSTINIVSSHDLFYRHITNTDALLESDIDVCKRKMLLRGESYLKKMKLARSKIAKQAAPSIEYGKNILTISKSKVVRDTILEAHRNGVEFTVYILTTAPYQYGEELYTHLMEAGVRCMKISDLSIAYIMEQIDIVLIGAEGIVKNGGIINQLGTYTLAICAKQMNKPVYVLAESFKFSSEYPLNQRDISNSVKFASSTIEKSEDLSKEPPLVDYTPPQYIDMLFTDDGFLPPIAVWEKQMKLYA